MPHSSRGFAQVSVLKPSASRTLAIWWLAVHAMLATAAIMLDRPLGETSMLLAAAAAHAWSRRPKRPNMMLLAPDGAWSFPELGRHDLRLAPGTAWSTWWVELELVDMHGRGTRTLLIKDQLDPEAWRKIQLAVRERGKPDT